MTELPPAQDDRDRPSSDNFETERVLVCLLASTRAHQLTFPSFKRQVLDELKGSLAERSNANSAFNFRRGSGRSTRVLTV